MDRKTERRELRRQLPLELARRMEAKSPQFSKTVFMKLAYLLQELYEVPLGYRFSLYSYGPYSPEVLADLEYAKLRREVDVEYLEEPQREFRIRAGEKAGQLNGGNAPIAKYKDNLNTLVEHFGAFNAKDLELRTTSVFLWKRIRPAKPEDVNPVIETVHQLKPHVEAATIEAAINGLLSSRVIRHYSEQ